MDWVFAILALYVFLIGCCIGSFLNVCAYRIPLGVSTISGRSFCPACKQPLRPSDMIPLLSYMLLRGKCRFCKTHISLRYPTVEAVSGLLFVAAFVRWGFNLHSTVAALLFAVLLLVALIDWDTGEIPDRMHLFLLFLAPFYIADSGFFIWEHLLGAFVVSLPLLVLALACGGFGGGDIKLTAAAGILLGWKVMLLAGALAVISAGIYGGVLLAKKSATHGSTMAFGPFLSAGMIFSALFGQTLWHWYGSFFR